MEQDALIGDETATSPAVRRVNKVGELLDSGVRIPGTNVTVGLDPILGIVPGVGDAVATGISLYIVFEAFRAGISQEVLLLMILNVAVDAVIGSVPVLGTVFDAFWKANEWNASIFADHVEATN